MAQPVVQLRRRGFGETMRRDAWWLPPLGVFVVLSSFLAYATWAAFQNANYEYGNYLSPFYSPLLFGDSHHAWFSRAPGWLAAISPALGSPAAMRTGMVIGAVSGTSESTVANVESGLPAMAKLAR